MVEVTVQYKGKSETHRADTLDALKISWAAAHKTQYPDRQAYKVQSTLKSVTGGSFESQGIVDGTVLLFKDLGPQVGWSTVFLTEYAGPLFVYVLFYLRPSFIYGAAAAAEPMSTTAQLAALCWVFHYAKRLYETVYVHRFSHATMPILNIFKNSGYYWGFAALVAYFINHPLYTSPSAAQVALCFIGFFVSEIGNYSIHVALRDLRPAGTKERKIPMPTGNPLTKLFGLVSCPNYTYEALSWFFFTLMTQSFTAFLFFAAGLLQMSLWALGKHKNYRKEFPTYPRRKAIIPYVL